MKILIPIVPCDTVYDNIEEIDLYLFIFDFFIDLLYLN